MVKAKDIDEFIPTPAQWNAIKFLFEAAAALDDEPETDQ
ncbi:hypothetical protein FHU31_002682 [Mycolicibacterium fluoranthenivorans]|uniref:Uncharacterized protein n=1 Tax=Mycolicibacterium fluoranthenivorans TaxID=258505 RepID=A0A7X5ZD49_9MYCO|nr:hypothetical protein [Mycolicibacterium fluoranthenivorans]